MPRYSTENSFGLALGMAQAAIEAIADFNFAGRAVAAVRDDDLEANKVADRDRLRAQPAERDVKLRPAGRRLVARC